MLVGGEALSFTVDESSAGRRLDLFLVARDLPLSRSQFKVLCEKGLCLVNDRPARVSLKVKPGDRIYLSVPPATPLDLQPEDLPLKILYEDEELIVIDKAAGMVVHPAPGHARGTLVAALLAHCTHLSGIGGVMRPGIVHRLDKLTSGVMVVSKSDRAHQALMEQFRSHSIERRYLALVVGVPSPLEGRFDTWHHRHPRDRKRFTSRVTKGRRAVTHYRVLERLPGASLVEAVLETGRTHQVRVHFSDAGHPILGDSVYGRLPKDPPLRGMAKQLGRQALHAYVLGFSHPLSQKLLRFEADFPADIAAVVAELRQ